MFDIEAASFLSFGRVSVPYFTDAIKKHLFILRTGCSVDVPPFWAEAS